MADVFVSYASADRDVAFRIVDYLEGKGIRCWVAPRDVAPGVEYGQAIIDAIEGARALVLVLSDQSNDSQFVRKEVERAVSKTKPVLPVRIREVTPSGALEFYISSAQWVDAWRSPMEQHLLPLVSAIQAMGPGAAMPARPTAPAAPRRRSAGPWIGGGVLAVSAALVLGLWLGRAPAPGDGPGDRPAVATPADTAGADTGARAESPAGGNPDLAATEPSAPAATAGDPVTASSPVASPGASPAAVPAAPPAAAPAVAPTAAVAPAAPSRGDLAFFTGHWCQPYNGMTIRYDVIRTGTDTVLTRVDHPQAPAWDVPSRVVAIAGGFEMQPVDEAPTDANVARFEIVDDRLMKLVFSEGEVQDGSILRMRCDPPG